MFSPGQLFEERETRLPKTEVFMRRRDRFFALAAALAVLGVFRLGEQLYSWHVFAPERAEISHLEEDLERAALGVIATQVRADTLRKALQALDLELRQARGRVDLAERDARDGSPAEATASEYRQALGSYHRRVSQRNALFRSWRQTLEENQKNVIRYNQLVESIRELAERMGEAYYPIRTPAEIAVLRGWATAGG